MVAIAAGEPMSLVPESCSSVLLRGGANWSAIVGDSRGDLKVDKNRRVR